MNLRFLGGVALFAALIAIGAQINFPLPGTSIPQTCQTIAVLMTGAFLGFNGASTAIAIYLLAGAFGLPVFSNGGSGLGTMFGPSGGYLLGFWFAACLIGWLSDKKLLRRPVWRLFLIMLGGHAIILGVGGGMLGFSVGPAAAWFNGIQPFIAGALIKSVVAGVIVLLADQRRR